MAKKNTDINSLSGDIAPKDFVKNKLSIEQIKKRFSKLLKNIASLSKKQKIVLCIVAVLIVSIGVLPWIFRGKKQQQENLVLQQEKPILQEEDIEITDELLQSLPKVATKLSKVDNQDLNSLIQKANLLYSHGDKVEALNVFDRIAIFSQSLANYNLGVMQAKQQDYQNALKSFEYSINAGEDISLSAFNAAMSAKYMGDEKLFSYYLTLANNQLPKESKRPFYSYLYTLVNFYNQNYFAALSSIKHPTSKLYIPQSSDIAAKTFLIFNDNENAIRALEMQEDSKKDYKNLGLLYARVGDFDKAKSYLSRYYRKHQEDFEALMAMQIVSLKTHQFYDAATYLDKIASNDALVQELNTIYPIKVVLQQKAFDVDLAQRDFLNDGLSPNYFFTDQILFYFAPFKVFDIQGALHVLRESGIFSAFNITAAEDRLFESQTIAQINQDIAQALIAIYRSDLRKALKILKQAAIKNPNHSILHYDLGLVYAQMQDIDNAYKHFVKSYYLDTKNLDAGLFAVLCAKYTDKDAERIKRDMTQDFEQVVGDGEKRNFFIAFLNYLNGGYSDGMQWVDVAKQKLPIYYALKAVLGMHAKNYQNAYDGFVELDTIYQDDLVAKTFRNIFYNTNTSVKQNALKLYNMIKQKKINLQTIYYGPALARNLYAYIGFVTGSLKLQEDALQERITASSEKPNGVLQALALINIYQHKFHEAYSIYDTLINELGENDTRTQFLAAVALIGTGDYDNAALLLQLSKMGAESSFETKYVLGLLYQQAGNFKAAASHYAMIAAKPFVSGFFDFEIDVQKILDMQK